MTIRVPLKDIPPDTKLKEGDNVRLSNGSTAIVKESTAEDIMLDFNPPMAGKALTFEVELLKITKVSSSLLVSVWGSLRIGFMLIHQSKIVPLVLPNCCKVAGLLVVGGVYTRRGDWQVLKWGSVIQVSGTLIR